MKIEISSGPYDVLGSGVIHVLEQHGAQLQIADLTINLLFETRADAGQLVETKVTGPKGAELRLINLDGALGWGNVEPMKLGTLEGKDLYFVYRVSSLSDTRIRTLEYSFYQPHE